MPATSESSSPLKDLPIIKVLTVLGVSPQLIQFGVVSGAELVTGPMTYLTNTKKLLLKISGVTYDTGLSVESLLEVLNDGDSVKKKLVKERLNTTLLKLRDKLGLGSPVAATSNTVSSLGPLSQLYGVSTKVTDIYGLMLELESGKGKIGASPIPSEIKQAAKKLSHGMKYGASPEQITKILKEGLDMSVTKEVMDMEEDTTGRVKLSKATALFQPVYATDKGSTYHVVGLSPHLNVAARIKSNGNLSVRVEATAGTDFKAYQGVLESIGFKMSVNEVGNFSHASFHANAGGTLQATMAIGAVIAGLPIKMTTDMQQVKTIVGKGC